MFFNLWKAQCSLNDSDENYTENFDTSHFWLVLIPTDWCYLSALMVITHSQGNFKRVNFNFKLHGWLGTEGTNAQVAVQFLEIPWETLIEIHYPVWSSIPYYEIRSNETAMFLFLLRILSWTERDERERAERERELRERKLRERA